jgi:glucose-1-phosphate thymidylyltransferase
MSMDVWEAPVGIIPCAGYASRLAPLPCSKELLPAGFQSAADGTMRLKVASEHLLERMHAGGVRTAFVVLRTGKWDIPAYYQEGAAGVKLAYLVNPQPFGPPYSLDLAYPFVADRAVAIGFPDIIFGPDDVYAQLFRRMSATGADAVLALYRAHDVRACDMADHDHAGCVTHLVLRPDSTDLAWTWIAAVWSPLFSRFVHAYLADPRTHDQSPDAGLPRELSVGHVIQAGIAAGFHVNSLRFPDAAYLDIGTPHALQRVIGPRSAEELAAR